MLSEELIKKAEEVSLILNLSRYFDIRLVKEWEDGYRHTGYRVSIKPKSREEIERIMMEIEEENR